ncbi:50S ribosomal protein L24 [Patescibacteria group bacterium]|nr:50S ribosomal protein L24 [Patescibacteria group bacterium]
MKIRKGDKVKIITGKDRGKVGTVLKVLKDKHKVLVEGVNVVRKHVKPGSVSKEGGIVNIEKPLDVSNVMFFNEKLNQGVRLGCKIIDGKKYRICKKSGEVV